jgi:uncharacterized damage-inducible protein DinB
MQYQILRNSIKRHLDETLPIIEQLIEVDIMNAPFPDGRTLGELVLHLLRSLEYYMKGVLTNQWNPLPYDLETYDSAEAIIQLAREVFNKVRVYTNMLSVNDLGRTIKSFNRPATVEEIILEMLEHSIHHRGQITAYYRLFGIKPAQIEYII